MLTAHLTLGATRDSCACVGRGHHERVPGLRATAVAVLPLVAASCDLNDADDTATSDDGSMEALAYVIDDRDGDALIEFRDLVPLAVAVEGDDPAERIRAALVASAQPTDEVLSTGARPALAPAAVPDVTVDGDVVILDYSSQRASEELAVWGTSSGSTALNAIVGMVFENAPEAQRLEQRLDGSCTDFTETMQGSGCQRDTRNRWQRYRTMAP